MGKTLFSLEGVHKRTVSHPHTSYLPYRDKFVSNAFPFKGRSRAGSGLGTGSMLGSELDLISPESSPGGMVRHRRISPDHCETFVDNNPILPISHMWDGSGHGDHAHTIANGVGLGCQHPSRRFEVGMERAKTKGVSGFGVGGRRAVSDTLSQIQPEPSSCPHLLQLFTIIRRCGPGFATYRPYNL